jgi:hypothetical protein
MANWKATGFTKAGHSAGIAWVSVGPTFLCSPREGFNHVNCDYMMTPSDARQLAADLVKAADVADDVQPTSAAEKPTP